MPLPTPWFDRVAIYDIDGTVADNRHRLHWIENKPEDWDGFYLTLSEDKPILKLIKRLKRQAKKGIHIVYMTGRQEAYRKETRKWLNKHIKGIKYELIMRPHDSKLEAPKLKVRMIEDYFRPLGLNPKDAVVEFWDDDERIIAAMKQIGINAKLAPKLD